MRLVEITRVVDHPANCSALSQQPCGVSGTFDLANGGVGDADRAQEVALLGSPRDRFRSPAQRSLDLGIARDQTLPDESPHERFRVLEAGVLPRGAIERE